MSYRILLSCSYFYFQEVIYTSIINVTNLTFAYDGSYDNIFENVSFQIDTEWKLGFTGRNGRGKTTLLNAIIAEIVRQFPDERICIIEDTGELQCAALNFVQYHTTINVTMTDILRLILRMRPDRIFVGETRGPEALDMLDAWNTGHEGGAASLHANNTLSALTRLRSLISRNPFAPREIEPVIGEAVNVIVQISKTSEGRRIKEIREIQGYENGEYISQLIAA